MAAVSTKNFLTNLIGAHEDLMSNLYLVTFYPPATDGQVVGPDDKPAQDKDQTQTGLTTDGSLSIRLKSFKAPAATHATHKVDFMTTSIDIPSPSIEITKSFDLTFRLDSGYQVYAFLKKWQEENLAEQYDFAGTHILGEGGGVKKEKPLGFKIKVEVLADRVDEVTDQQASSEEVKDKDGKVIKTTNSTFGGKSAVLYEFDYCWVSAIKGLDYSYDSADPLEVTATIHFLDYTVYR